ncbi:MAG: PHP domain-containing protein [Desulfuromonadales bacterium]
MKSFIDLHLHSSCSDGIHSPTELVRRAARAGLRAIAICDHDNVDGIEEGMAAGREMGVEVIPGVELSAIWEDIEDLHLLGYGFDHRDPELRQSLREFQQFRAGRNERILAQVNEKLAGENKRPIAFAEVLARAAGTLGRPHIAMALIEHGYVANSEEAFQRYLVPCNVGKRYFPIGDAIDLIHRAGGVTSLAHPPFITADRSLFLRLLDALVALGLEGIEAYNNGSSNDDIDWYITQARRRSLIVTGGTDFHGIDDGDLVLGGPRGNLKVPFSCVEEIRAAKAHRAGK